MSNRCEQCDCDLDGKSLHWYGGRGPFCLSCTMESIERPSFEQRLAKMEQALRIIQTWAACFDSRIESADKAMDDIENKCREALEQP